MRYDHGIVLALLARVVVSTTPSCVPLIGIEKDGDGTATLNLDDMRVSLELEVFDFNNAVVPALVACSSGLETSVAMRTLLAIQSSSWSVASAFQPPPVLNIFGDRQTSDERRRCYPDTPETIELFSLHYKVAALYVLAHAALKAMPFCHAEIDPLMLGLDHPMSFMEEGEDASIDTSTPWGLAQAYVDEGWDYLTANDGWNADGSMGGREFNRVPFSGDFSMTDSEGNSWTPYVPRNSPNEFTDTKKWQPLEESDGLGYITTQEHVTPHIGSTGRYFGFSSKEDEEAFSSRTIDRPDYLNRYKDVVHDVLDESAMTADSLYKQVAISFFDDKVNSLIPLSVDYFLRNTTQAEYTTTEFLQLSLEIQLALYNGVLLTWKEKIHHDRPRPSTMIKHKLGDELVEAYAGPGEGVQTMKASEWESFMRTNPTSEYPSASACLCELFARQVENFLGDDKIEPPLQFPPGPPPPGFDEPPLVFSSWSEISQVCGDSRVWGGVNFAGAVPAGAELCGGMDMAMSIHDSLERLKAGDESAAIFKTDVGELMRFGASFQFLAMPVKPPGDGPPSPVIMGTGLSKKLHACWWKKGDRNPASPGEVEAT